MKKNDPKSMLAFITSMLIFGTIGIFRRYIDLPSSVLACVRGFTGSLFLVILALIQRKKFSLQMGAGKLLLLILSGMLIGFNWLLLFEAYNYTTVATATLCYYMQPTIVILISPFIFRERLTAKKGICALVAIIGMIFVSGILGNAQGGGEDMKGVALGLGAAALYATVVTLNKKLPGIDVYMKTIVQLFSAAAVLVPYILLTENIGSIHIQGQGLIMVLVVGLVHTGIAYYLYFGSMDGLRAQSLALFSYIDPVSALLLSVIFLGEPLSFIGMAGAVMILGAALISEL